MCPPFASSGVFRSCSRGPVMYWWKMKMKSCYQIAYDWSLYDDFSNYHQSPFKEHQFTWQQYLLCPWAAVCSHESTARIYFIYITVGCYYISKLGMKSENNGIMNYTYICSPILVGILNYTYLYLLIYVVQLLHVLK